MSKLLITGSSGFLGRHLLKYSEREHLITAQYRHHKPENYGKPIEFLPLDLESSRWDELYRTKADTIIHTAAMASIDECETQPNATKRINYEATKKLADFADVLNARFIFISSDVVFDGKKGDYSEEDPPCAVNIYAQSKMESEKYLLNKLKNVVVIRPALFYGLALNGRPSFTEILLNNLRAGKQAFLFTDQIRSPVFVVDLAKSVLELVENSYTGILHLGGPDQLSRMQLGKILCQIFHLDESLLIPVKSTEANLIARRPLNCSLNISKARSILKTKFVDCKTGLHLSFH